MVPCTSSKNIAIDYSFKMTENTDMRKCVSLPNKIGVKLRRIKIDFGFCCIETIVVNL